MSEQARARPLAVIREAECIGCGKCIQACPVDAILGSARKMHTVIADECIGCKLCLPPCPVDCIDLRPAAQATPAETSPEARKQKAALIKRRYADRQKRLQNNEEQQYPTLASLLDSDPASELDERKTYIQNAVARMKSKKTTTR